MNSLHVLKILSCRILDSKGFGLRLHAFRFNTLKKIDKTPTVLFIPLVIDTIRGVLKN